MQPVKGGTIMKRKTLFSIVALIVSMLAAPNLFSQGQQDEDGVVTVKMASQFWVEPGRKELYESFKAEFEAANPDIVIEPVAMSYTEYFDKIDIVLASSNAPVIFFGTEAQIKLWKEMGYLEPLNEHFDIPKLMTEVSSPESQKKAEIDGNMYGLYLEACPYGGLIYNEELLEKAGVKVPTTPEELLRAAKTLTIGNQQYGFITANSPDNLQHIMQEVMLIINGFGGRIINAKGDFGVADPEFIEGVKFWKELNKADAVPQNMVYNTQRKLFFAGKVAMCLDGGYFVTWAMSENPELAKKLDVAYPPFADMGSQTDITFFFINKEATDRQKAAAARVLQAYMQPSFQEKWVRQCGYPVTMKNAVTPAFREEFPWFKVYEDIAAHGVSMAVKGHETQSSEIRKIVANYLLIALNTDSPVEEVMKECKEELIQVTR